MNILFIYDGEYPWDVRVEKIGKTFKADKHNVYLLCRNYRAETLYEKVGGFFIYRLPFLSRKSVFLNRLINFPLFFSPFWIIWAAYVIFTKKCDLIVVRDLPLALTGILLARVFKLQVILDMAEVYPEALRSNWLFDESKMGGINHVLRNPSLAEMVEKLVIKFIDHVFVVSEESKNRLLKLYSCSKDKISIVRNTPETSKFYPRDPSFPGSLDRIKNKKIIFFSGFLLGDRGLSLAIKAMPEILKKVKDTYLVIIGEGIEKENLVELVEELELNEKVIFEGWVPNHLIPDYAASCTIGILPFFSCTHIEITLANKLFDYMAVGLPIVASNVRPMKRIIEAEECGILFKANDREDFTNNVIELLNNRQRMNEMSKNGVIASEGKYNWKQDSARVIKVISKYNKSS